jgi:hypothetical protein
VFTILDFSIIFGGKFSSVLDTTAMRNFIICTHPQIPSVKANEVGGACGTHGRGEKSVQGFGGKARWKESTWKTKARRWEDGIRMDLRGSRVSSGSIVSDYGLDDRAIGVGYPAGARIFPLSSVSRSALGPTQPPVQWVPGVLSPGVKRGRGVMLITHPNLVPR